MTITRPPLYSPDDYGVNDVTIPDLNGVLGVGVRTAGARVLVTSPTLLKVSLLTDLAGAPIFSTQPVCIRLYAVPEKYARPFEPPTSPIGGPYPRSDAYRKGSGPFLYLPAAGQWRVWLRADRNAGAPAVAAASCILQQNVSPELAASYYAGLAQASEIVQGGVTLGAGGQTIIPDPAVVGPAGDIGMARYWALQSVSISNIGGAGCNINVGQIATATTQPLGAGGNNLKQYPEIAGASFHVFSTAGTDIVYRVRYY